MRNLILKLHDFLRAHKGWAVLLLVVLLTLSVLSALRLQFQEDISAFLPEDSREQLQETAGDEKMAVFFQGGSPEERQDAVYDFQDHWEEVFPEIELYEGAAGEQVAEVFDAPLDDLGVPLPSLRCIKNKYIIKCPVCGASMKAI